MSAGSSFHDPLSATAVSILTIQSAAYLNDRQYRLHPSNLTGAFDMYFAMYAAALPVSRTFSMCTMGEFMYLFIFAEIHLCEMYGPRSRMCKCGLPRFVCSNTARYCISALGCARFHACTIIDQLCFSFLAQRSGSRCHSSDAVNVRKAVGFPTYASLRSMDRRICTHSSHCQRLHFNIVAVAALQLSVSSVYSPQSISLSPVHRSVYPVRVFSRPLKCIGLLCLSAHLLG